MRRNRDCARGERNMEEKGGKGGGRRANLHTLQTRANPWFTCLDRYSSSRALSRQGTSSGGRLFLLLLPVKIIPLSFLFPFYFFLKFFLKIHLSFNAGKNRGLFSWKGNKGKRRGDTKTTMGFAEAEQTDRASKRCLRHIVDIQLRLSGQLKAGWLSSSEVFKNVLLRVGCERKRWLEKKL